MANELRRVRPDDRGRVVERDRDSLQTRPKHCDVQGWADELGSLAAVDLVFWLDSEKSNAVPITLTRPQAAGLARALIDALAMEGAY